MCGRLALSESAIDLDRILGHIGLARGAVNWRPRYNVAPTQDVLVVVEEMGQLRIEPRRWGLVPSWSKDLKIKFSTFNARLEEAPAKPMCRTPFRDRRCIVLADGFFEWKFDEQGKIPYFFRPKGGGILGLAGLWDRWSPFEHKLEGPEVFSCSILTTASKGLISEYHDRMPVMLARDDWKAWNAQGSREPAKSIELLATAKPVELEAIRVSTLVNNTRNEGPEILKPVL